MLARIADNTTGVPSKLSCPVVLPLQASLLRNGLAAARRKDRGPALRALHAWTEAREIRAAPQRNRVSQSKFRSPFCRDGCQCPVLGLHATKAPDALPAQRERKRHRKASRSARHLGQQISGRGSQSHKAPAT